MARLRPIAPLDLPQVPRATDFGRPPVLRWVAPTGLLVDETYQRELRRQSLALIKRIVAGWAWNRMKPPIVIEAPEGLHVIDGQHTAIAAATIGLPEIPIFLVDAGSIDERARTFVAHNRDRISMSPIDIHRALVAAGDDAALDVANVCRRAGVNIRTINQSTTVAIGDTSAVGTVGRIVRRHGVQNARRALQCLVAAGRAPITESEIIAAAHVLCAAKNTVDPERLTVAIRADGIEGLMMARARSSIERHSIWKVLAERWMARMAGRQP